MLIPIAAVGTTLLFQKRSWLTPNSYNYLSNQTTFLLATIAPCICSLLLNASYSYIRYQSFLPTSYLSESIDVSTSITFKLESLLAIFLAPQGGLIFFWGLAIILCIYSNINYTLSSYSFFFSSFFFILCCLVSVLWWAPFGWDSWGNRLIIPSIMPFLALLAIPKYDNEPNLNLRLKSDLNATSSLLILAVAVCSSYYLICSYSPWGRIQLMRDYLYQPRECQVFIAKLRSGTSAQYPTREYEACASTRYWAWPELRLPAALSSQINNHQSILPK